jgi:hypothetical protein
VRSKTSLRASVWWGKCRWRPLLCLDSIMADEGDGGKLIVEGLRRL